jgi:tRNA pseudouridine(38-40) synthase
MPVCMRWQWWLTSTCPPGGFPCLPENLRLRSTPICPLIFGWSPLCARRRIFTLGFGPRDKEYRYCVWNHRFMNPLLRHQAWHVPAPLDLQAMRAAAAELLGRHDFRSFAANRSYRAEQTVRELTQCSVRRQGSLLTFTLRADGFPV